MLKVLPKNDAGRDFVVGDLHGCFDQFQLFLDHVNFDPKVDRMFSVGDLVDRGPKNQECLRLLEKPWFNAVKGNHEDMMCGALVNQGEGGAWWEYNGGGWFKDTKYSTSPQEFSFSELKDFVSTFVVPLPLVIHVEDSFHIVHAELNSEDSEVTSKDIADPMQTAALAATRCLDGLSALWKRHIWYGRVALDVKDIKYLPLNTIDKFKNSLPLFSGHTPVTHPTKINNLVNLDTMAFATGRRPWAGLSFCEPKTMKFWTVKDSVAEVEPTEISL